VKGVCLGNKKKISQTQNNKQYLTLHWKKKQTQNNTKPLFWFLFSDTKYRHDSTTFGTGHFRILETIYSSFGSLGSIDLYSQKAEDTCTLMLSYYIPKSC